MMDQYDKNLKIRKLIGNSVNKGRNRSSSHDQLQNNESDLGGGMLTMMTPGSPSRESSCGGYNSESDTLGLLEPRPIRKAEKVSPRTGSDEVGSNNSSKVGLFPFAR